MVVTTELQLRFQRNSSLTWVIVLEFLLDGTATALRSAGELRESFQSKPRIARPNSWQPVAM